MLTAAPIPQPKHPNDLDAAQERAVRAAVYGKKAKIEPLTFRDINEVLIPTELAEVYTARPRATIDLLLAIVEGGNPDDSVAAAAYGIALLGSPNGAAVCVEYFDAKKYDEIDEDWKHSPRKHWVRNLRRDIAKKWPEK